MQTYRRKVFLGFGASLFLMVMILGLAIFLILRLGRASESILQENYRSILAAENMIDAIERAGNLQRDCPGAPRRHLARLSPGPGQHVYLSPPHRAICRGDFRI
jgi:hypothetical protein